jgi:single-strand DNA-binding protein
MASMNNVILIGRLGKDPTIKEFSSGSINASFSLATSFSYKDKDGEKKEKTDWHNIVVWGKSAEYCDKYLHKGDLVNIVGRISYRDYEDKEGNTKYITEIVADRVQSLEAKKKDEKEERAARPKQEARERPAKSAARQDNEEEDDDLPF